MLKNVSPELIENVKDLKIALNELTVHDLNVYSMSELYYKVAHKLNEVIRELSRFEGVLSDEVIKQNEKLIYLLGEGLENEVIKNIDRLIEQNFFEEVINEKIFSGLNNKIDNFKSEIDSQLEHITNKKIYIKSNGVDDTKIIQNALNNKGIIILNDDNYYITDTLYVKSDTIIEGVGILNCNLNTDCLSVNTSSSNIKIKGVTIKNAKRFGIQVYGETLTDKPHDIKIENVKTINCGEGGMFLNSCYDITVRNCFNDGGVRAIGTFAPISNPLVTYNILIDKCDSINTTSFGHQTYYGENITITNCNIDGLKTINGDRSCITIDRTKNSIVVNNTLKNAVSSNIFVTGSDGITVSDNVCLNGEYGIQCIFNLESQEDAKIKENKNTIISNNIIKDSSVAGVMLNSCLNHNVINNNISSSIGIYIMQQIRERDNTQMISDKINIISNTLTGKIQISPITGSCDFLYNTYTSIEGLTNNKVIDNKTLRVDGLSLQGIGLIKKERQSHTDWILENRYSDESYHKGWYITNNYGIVEFVDSTGGRAFGINVSNGDNKKDLELYKSGAGLIVKSPDGKIRKRIGVSNSGELILTNI